MLTRYTRIRRKGFGIQWLMKYGVTYGDEARGTTKSRNMSVTLKG